MQKDFEIRSPLWLFLRNFHLGPSAWKKGGATHPISGLYKRQNDTEDKPCDWIAMLSEWLFKPVTQNSPSGHKT